jgi:hypothetical protein
VSLAKRLGVGVVGAQEHGVERVRCMQGLGQRAGDVARTLLDCQRVDKRPRALLVRRLEVLYGRRSDRLVVLPRIQIESIN